MMVPGLGTITLTLRPANGNRASGCISSDWLTAAAR
jgi:hypothetical protein